MRFPKGFVFSEYENMDDKSYRYVFPSSIISLKKSCCAFKSDDKIEFNEIPKRVESLINKII